MSTGPLTEGHWQVSAWVSDTPLAVQTWQALAGQSTMELGLQSQTSRSKDAAENVAFLVGALCRPGGFHTKGTFQLRLELRHGLVVLLWLRHGFRLVTWLWLRHGLRSRHGLGMELRHRLELRLRLRRQFGLENWEPTGSCDCLVGQSRFF